MYITNHKNNQEFCTSSRSCENNSTWHLTSIYPGFGTIPILLYSTPLTTFFLGLFIYCPNIKFKSTITMGPCNYNYLFDFIIP